MAKPTPKKPLAPATTLDLGGDAEWFVETESETEIHDALRWAADRKLPVSILGGGSNVVVGDSGVRGLVLKIGNRGLDLERHGDRTTVTVAAGEDWDDVVRTTVGEGLAGIECLAGIPGTVGATPIQNVGAYGQEVGSVISRVRVLDRETLQESTLTAADCDFKYRSSRFRRPGNPFIILEVAFDLRHDGSPSLSYSQVAERFEPGSPPSLGELRAAILDLRRSKSMVLDDDDPNRRSVGSFFVNPTVDRASFESLVASARALGVLGFDQEPPAHPVGEDHLKLSAAWLVENAGFPRGCVRGRVGLSTNHALALIHRGGGTATELVAFAGEIRRGVRSHLGVDLEPEPVFWGFPSCDPTT